MTPAEPDISNARQGLVVETADAERFDAAIALALDYRGDITLRLRSGEAAEGYLYDRKRSAGGKPALLRILPSDGSPRVSIPLDDIERIEFTGRDTASGRSFETWMKKYVERKLAGEEASIRSEPLRE